MRTLQPDRMFVTSSGVWVLDERQPVAAVLDPGTGALRRVVSWAQLPPPPPGEDVVVLADEDGLWVQHSRLGPLVRVDLDGVVTRVWTHGLGLAATGPGGAWCTSPPPAQELVRGEGAEPVTFTTSAAVARVERNGTVRTVFTDAPVRGLVPSAEALWVQVDVEPVAKRDLGAGTFEVNWSSSWVPLPWTGTLPPRVEAANGQREEPPSAADPLGGDGRWHGYLFDPDAAPDSPGVVEAAGWLWRTGWQPGEQDPAGARSRERTVATASAAPRTGGPGNTSARVFDLGGGGIRAAAAVGEHLVVVTGELPPSLAPTAEASRGGRPAASVVVLDPVTGGVRLWSNGDDIDISEQCWPLVPRPLDADSYAQQVLSVWSGMDSYWQGPDGDHPLASGLSGSRARLVGQWPTTRVEFTFDHASRPGVRLRRYIPLFDELGAIDHSEYADIGLMEDLDTGRVPPLTDARDGFLDV